MNLQIFPFFVSDGLTVEEMLVRFGENHFNLPNAERREFSVQKTIMPENYKKTATSLDNDVAIVQLKTQVTFSNAIKPICLPPTNFVAEGVKDAVVAGRYNNHPILVSHFKTVPIQL